MAELEAVVELLDGRVNGWHDVSVDAETILTPTAGPRIRSSTIEAPPQEPVSVAAESMAKVSPTVQSTTTAGAKAHPAVEKNAKQKSRPRNSDTTKTAQPTSPDRPTTKYVPQAELNRELASLEMLSQAALAGDETAHDKLRSALDRCPHVWRRLADLQVLIEHKLVALIAGNDPLRLEAFRKRASELRHHLLEGETSSLATKMAASRVVSCWLFTQLLELRALQSPDELRNIQQLEQSERRYQVAMRTFCLARQSDLPRQRIAQHGN